MKIVSFFAGCGGLDLGFEQAGFNVIWANEFDKQIHETYSRNHPKTFLSKKDIRDLSLSEIPDCDGFIGGPPCQSWSYGGKQLGLDDERGRLFLDYIKIIKGKRPKFFVIENVEGIISDKHFKTFLSFLNDLREADYDVYYKLLNASDFKIPQDRKRVFIVGFRKELKIAYSFPQPSKEKPITLKQAIGDITISPSFYSKEQSINIKNALSNHDVYNGAYDAKFMARNRVRSWDEVSFTIQAQAKNCPLHPQAPKMQYIDSTHRCFVKGKESLYRRLSVRECARIQSFPDWFTFYYNNVIDGYKMVGNAVPPRLAKAIAISINNCLKEQSKLPTILVGYFKDDNQLKKTLENKLYYVRAGLRRGALQLPIGVIPQYVYLHRAKYGKMFKLKNEEPTIKTAEYLDNLGFTPSGGIYLTFQLESTIPVETEPITLKGTGNNIAIPYLI